jgi:hypothetical protein
MQAATLCAETSVLRDFVSSKPPNYPTPPVTIPSALCLWPRRQLTVHKIDLQQQKLSWLGVSGRLVTWNHGPARMRLCPRRSHMA